MIGEEEKDKKKKILYDNSTIETKKDGRHMLVS
jgi:hypothetical protein